jgi:hypothetical protein
MNRLLNVALIGMALVMGSAQAADFNYVQAGYAVTDSANRSSDSWSVAASKELGSKLYVVGNYTKGMDADLEAGVVGAGVGLHTPISTNAEIYGQVEATTVVANRNDRAKYDYRAETGVRLQLTPSLELRGGALAGNIRAQSMDEVQWRGFVGAEYALTKYVKVGATAIGKSGNMEGLATVRLYY